MLYSLEIRREFGKARQSQPLIDGSQVVQSGHSRVLGPHWLRFSTGSAPKSALGSTLELSAYAILYHKVIDWRIGGSAKSVEFVSPKNAEGGGRCHSRTRRVVHAFSLSSRVIPEPSAATQNKSGTIAHQTRESKTVLGSGRVEKVHRYLSYLNSHQVMWYHFLHQGKNLCQNPFSH